MTSGRRRENVGKASGMILDICTLRDDDVSYGDYLEQLIYLLFLKMAWPIWTTCRTRTYWPGDR